MQIKTYHIYFSVKEKKFYKIEAGKSGFLQDVIDERVESFIPACGVEQSLKTCTERYKAIAKR